MLLALKSWNSTCWQFYQDIRQLKPLCWIGDSAPLCYASLLRTVCEQAENMPAEPVHLFSGLLHLAQGKARENS